MPSWQSRLFLFLLKNRNLFKFKLKREPEVTRDTSIPELRAKTEKAGRLFGKVAKDMKIIPSQSGGIYSEWIIPENAPDDKAILYFHGGGYVIGSAQGHRPHVAKVAKGTGIKALTFSYRLAPEYPFPAGLDDAISIYKSILEEGFLPENIVFMGDSAGGGLCLATLLALKQQNAPLPCAAVALSPWTDLLHQSESLSTNADIDHLTWKESWNVFADYYAGSRDRSNPLISPVYGDLAGLPPIYISVGNDELLRDDSIRFANRAKDAGVDVILSVGEGMFHCYAVCSPLFPEAKKEMDAICTFIKKHLGE